MSCTTSPCTLYMQAWLNPLPSCCSCQTRILTCAIAHMQWISNQTLQHPTHVGAPSVKRLHSSSSSPLLYLHLQVLRGEARQSTYCTLQWLLKHTTQAFQDFHKACYWTGGAFGFDRADEIVSLLQAFQLGNAGVAQVVARHIARMQLGMKPVGQYQGTSGTLTLMTSTPALPRTGIPFWRLPRR